MIVQNDCLLSVKIIIVIGFLSLSPFLSISSAHTNNDNTIINCVSIQLKNKNWKLKVTYPDHRKWLVANVESAQILSLTAFEKQDME